MDPLARYAGLVRTFATRMNLVSGDDLDRFEERHIDDSLRALRLLDELPEGICVDVGSGAGLPGIPLAIAQPNRRWRLIEPRQRRAAFLEEVVRELGLANVEVLTMTAELAAQDARWAGVHVLATARALAEPSRAVELLLPLVGPGGVLLVFTGAGSEVPAGAQEWEKGIAIVRADPDQRATTE